MSGPFLTAATRQWQHGNTVTRQHSNTATGNSGYQIERRGARLLSFSYKRANDVSGTASMAHSWPATHETLRYNSTIREEDHLLCDELKMSVARTSRRPLRRVSDKNMQRCQGRRPGSLPNGGTRARVPVWGRFKSLEQLTVISNCIII